MKQRRIIFSVLVTAIILVAVLLFWPHGTSSKSKNLSQPVAAQTSSTLSPLASSSTVQKVTPFPGNPQAQAERRKEIVEKIESSLATPITFYGRVIDQDGAPVAEANIKFGTIDKFDVDGSRYEGKSDADGNFSISGIKGAVLTVGVWKNGYYIIEDKSKGSFAYGIGPDATRREPPSKENPAIFVLKKMGVTEPLIRVSSLQINVPKTGQPLNIDLATGRAGQGNLQVESWTGNSKQRPYDWRFRLSVPGGGIVERKEQFTFKAPDDGYQPAIEINMPANSERWSSDVTRNYFAKLPDGRYARFAIDFYPGDRNFVVLESYVNPTSGSQNLEFDPKKVVKSP